MKSQIKAVRLEPKMVLDTDGVCVYLCLERRKSIQPKVLMRKLQCEQDAL